MIQNKNQLRHLDDQTINLDIIYLDTNNSYDYAVSKFLPTSRFIQVYPKEFYLNKYNSNSSKNCVLEVDL